MGFAAMIDRTTLDHAVDTVAVDKRAVERLEQEKSGALSAHIAICTFVERLAGTCRRQCPHLGYGDMPGGIENETDTASQRHLAFATLKGLYRRMNGVQRTGTASIDREARATQAENV